jgi:Methylamine utilisation protein MauE
MVDPVAGYLIVWSIALMFASASFHKLRDMRAFAESVAGYRLFPAIGARAAALSTVLIEVAVVAMSLWPASRRMANLLGVCLLAAYAMAMALNLARGRKGLNCGCGAADEHHPIALWMVVRNLLLIGALGVAMLPWSVRAMTGTDLLTIAGGVTVAAGFYLIADRLFGENAALRYTFRSTT